MKEQLTILITALLISTLAAASVPEQVDKTYSVAPKVPIKAYAFSLKDVRLLDGPFKKAMDIDAKYLLDLSPDRFMCMLRKQAGLEPKGKVYGGWEGRGLSGHVLGHYISACSMMYAASDDKRYLKRVNYLVDELAECQKAHGNGYVGGVPEAKRIFSEVAEGKIKAGKFSLNKGWVPWYNLHKLYQGLVDAYRLCGSEKAKKIVVAMTDWAVGVTGKLTDKQMQGMLVCEIGGMNEALADVYAITGKPEHLKLAGRFNDISVLNPLTQRQDKLEGLHANTQIPKVIGAARQYELTANKDLRTATEFFWEVVTRDRSYVNGGNSEREHFRKKGELWKRLTTKAAETCNTYNMLKLTRHLLAWTGEGQYAEYYERALYNHILASQEPKQGGMIYFCSLKPGHFHTYNTPDNSFWCCTGSGIENHVKYGESIYFHDDKSLQVNLFIASELTWKAKGLKVTQQTKFPYEPKTRFVFACDKPVKLALKIRHPKWVGPALKVTVNGKKTGAASKPGEYLSIDRTWARGDAVDVELPMSLRLEPMKNRPQIAAIMYGPILLAGRLGREGMTDKMPYSSEQWTFSGHPTPPVPDLAAEGKPVADWLKPVAGKPLEFKTAGVGRPREVSLIPFFKAHHQRYTVYWDIMTEKAWQEQEAKRLAEEKRLKDLKERTIDEAVPQKESEKAHNLKGGNMLAGAAFNRHWRHAWPGSWFSYDLKVDPAKPIEVVVTCWGGDKGKRGFDVKVGDTKIGEQTLIGDKPGVFFDTVHKVPEKLTKGKNKITVRFEAHKGKIGGGIFGVKTARRKGGAKSPAPAPAPPASVSKALRKKLDPFYKQYVVVDGLLITASEKVNKRALQETAHLVRKLLANRPDVLANLVKRNVYVTVIAYNEMQTQMPECRGLPSWYDRRARGLGGNPISCGEENLLGYKGDPYRGESIFIHEFAHGLHGAFSSLDKKFRRRVEALYEKTKAAKRFRGYGMNNFGEFFSEGVQSWFNTNLNGGLVAVGPKGKQICQINTKEQLKKHLPELAKILAEAFGPNKWVYQPVAKRMDQSHLRGFDVARAPVFRWPERAIKAYRDEQARKRKQRK